MCGDGQESREIHNMNGFQRQTFSRQESQGAPRKGLTVGTLGCWTAYEEVIGFYISINEVLLVDRLHAGKLGPNEGLHT